MLLGVFCVYDKTAVTFGTPFFTHNRGSAIRGIRAQIDQDKTSMLARYPADFQLFDLGTYEEETGKFHTSPPVLIIDVSQLMEAPNEQQQVG